MTNKQRMEAENAVRSLEGAADVFMKVDGDRDHMNRSDLRCEQTQAAAQLMRGVATWLKALAP